MITKIRKVIAKYFKFIIRAPLYLFFYSKGIVRYRWDRLAEDFINDFFNYKNASLKEKIWAYKRGFLSERIGRYGLDEHNYMNYMPDLDFYKKDMYKNRRFYYWFDDKITTWYILQPFSKYLPVHYYSIENKKIRQLLSNDLGFNNSVNGILQLIREKHEVAFKESRGGHGRGFLKISCDNNQYSLNGKSISISDLEKLIKSLNGYIITEYIHAHSELRKIYAETPSIIRFVTIYDEKKGAQVTASIIRFGTSKVGLITDYEGSIYCGVNIKNGTLFKPMIEMASGIEPCPVHPDTGIKIGGVIPNWNLITNKVIEISNYLNNTPYLTYDIVSTDDGFKILEINSHGMLRIIQPFYPFYENEYQKNLFFD